MAVYSSEHQHTCLAHGGIHAGHTERVNNVCVIKTSDRHAGCDSARGQKCRSIHSSVINVPAFLPRPRFPTSLHGTSSQLSSPPHTQHPSIGTHSWTLVGTHSQTNTDFTLPLSPLCCHSSRSMTLSRSL